MKLKRFISWPSRHKKPVLIVLLIIIFAAVIWAFIIALKVQESVVRTSPEASANSGTPAITIIPEPLTGLEIEESIAQRPVTMAIIENSPEARPQSGLDKAGLIFESIAEGGITRFVTFFQAERPDPLGPIRSLRPYFNDWALTLDASVAHVGGSTTALAEVRTLGIKDLDQFFNSQAYYRTTDRFAPHNVYTDFDRLDALNKSKGFTSSEFDPLPRKDDAPVTTPKAKSITIDISSYLYQVDYTYDAETNSYLRFQAGAPHINRESGKQLNPKVVVVLNVPFSIGGDGRYAYDLVGSGNATIFQDGRATAAKWSKKSRGSQLVLKDTKSKAIELNAGQTWITAISPSQKATYGP